MTPHAKVYMNHFDYATPEEIPCEMCENQAVDIHHINGRGKDKNIIGNLMALCRKHHEQATLNKLSKGEVQYIHNCFLVGQRQIFVK
jgi:hypothetical protein